MRTPQPLPEGAVERLTALLKEAKSKAETNAFSACGCGRPSVYPQNRLPRRWAGRSVRCGRCIRTTYVTARPCCGVSPGGRHRQNLTVEQEKELLLPFLQQAEAGGVLVVAPVQAAYEAAVGRPVHHSVG